MCCVAPRRLAAPSVPNATYDSIRCDDLDELGEIVRLHVALHDPLQRRATLTSCLFRSNVTSTERSACGVRYPE
jgi:hypothetical protein